MVSSMVKLPVVTEELPQASEAVKVTVIVLIQPPLQVPGVFVQVIGSEQMSEAVAPPLFASQAI